MNQKPFNRLPVPRAANRPELPPDLAEFYARHEGIGLGSSCEYVVRISTLEEVARIAWDDVSVADVPEWWERFAGLRVGLGMYGEKIVYVLDAPSCPPGSILAIGTILSGCEGGHGPFRLNSSIVLGKSLASWLEHLEQWEWEEPIIAGMGSLPKPKWEEARRYYRELNAEARDWEAPDESA